MAKNLVYKRGPDIRDEKGIYTWKGQGFPSQSKVYGPYSDFLFAHIHWIAEEVQRLTALHEAGFSVEWWDYWDEVWSMREYDPLSLLTDPNYISKAGLRALKRAADRGSTIDDLLCRYAEGMRPDESELHEVLEELIYGHSRMCTVEEVVPYATHLLRYLDTHHPKYAFSQLFCYNETDRIAGRLDHIKYESGKFILQSLKTTQSDSFGIERRWIAQETTYANMEVAVVSDSHIELDMPQVDEIEWLIIRPEGYHLRRMSIDKSKEWWTGFCQPAIRAYHALKELPLPPKGTTYAGT